MAGVIAQVTAGHVLALYAAIAATLPAVFWLVRDVPRDWSCGEDEPPGQDAKLGAVAALVGAVYVTPVLLLALAGLSLARTRRRDLSVAALGWTLLLLGLPLHFDLVMLQGEGPWFCWTGVT